MYSVRAQIVVNRPIEEEKFRSPNEFIAYLSECTSSKEIQKSILENLLYRLAYISYETFYKSHDDDYLFRIADEIISKFVDENYDDEDYKKYKIKKSIIRTHYKMHLLVIMNDHYGPLRFSQLIRRKRQIRCELHRYKMNGKKVPFGFWRESVITIFDLFKLIRARWKMINDVNRYCDLLRELEVETILLNSNVKISPHAYINENFMKSDSEVYRYLASKKILFIDSDEMIDTLISLNIEYSKYYGGGMGYFKMFLQAENDPHEIEKGIPEIDEDIDMFKKNILYSILKDAEVGYIRNGLFFIRRFTDKDHSRIYRTVCFAAKIISDYQDHIGRKVTQEYLMKGIYSVQDEVFQKYLKKQISLAQVLGDKQCIDELKSLKARMQKNAIGVKKASKAGIELKHRKRILKEISEKYPEILSPISSYSKKDKFYTETIPEILDL